MENKDSNIIECNYWDLLEEAYQLKVNPNYVGLSVLTKNTSNFDFLYEGYKFENDRNKMDSFLKEPLTPLNPSFWDYRQKAWSSDDSEEERDRSAYPISFEKGRTYNVNPSFYHSPSQEETPPKINLTPENCPQKIDKNREAKDDGLFPSLPASSIDCKGGSSGNSDKETDCSVSTKSCDKRQSSKVSLSPESDWIDPNKDVDDKLMISSSKLDTQDTIAKTTNPVYLAPAVFSGSPWNDMFTIANIEGKKPSPETSSRQEGNILKTTNSRKLTKRFFVRRKHFRSSTPKIIPQTVISLPDTCPQQLDNIKEAKNGAILSMFSASRIDCKGGSSNNSEETIDCSISPKSCDKEEISNVSRLPVPSSSGSTAFARKINPKVFSLLLGSRRQRRDKNGEATDKNALPPLLPEPSIDYKVCRSEDIVEEDTDWSLSSNDDREEETDCSVSPTRSDEGQISNRIPPPVESPNQNANPETISPSLESCQQRHKCGDNCIKAIHLLGAAAFPSIPALSYDFNERRSEGSKEATDWSLSSENSKEKTDRFASLISLDIKRISNVSSSPLSTSYLANKHCCRSCSVKLCNKERISKVSPSPYWPPDQEYNCPKISPTLERSPVRKEDNIREATDDAEHLTEMYGNTETSQQKNNTTGATKNRQKEIGRFPVSTPEMVRYAASTKTYTSQEPNTTKGSYSIGELERLFEVLQDPHPSKMRQDYLKRFEIGFYVELDEFLKL